MSRIILSLCSSLALGTVVAGTSSEWPFAILRSYGSAAGNPRFTERIFAAQERHPGLIDEIWFAGGVSDIFASPEEFGTGAAKENLAARDRCHKLGIAFSYQQGVTLNHAPDDRPHPGYPDDCWVVDRDGKLRRGLFCCTSPFTRDYTFRKASAILKALQPDAYWPDDDVRLFKEDWRKPCICFCDRCLDRFSKKVGRNFDRVSLLAALEGPDASAAIRRAWCDFNGEVLGEYAAAFRRAVDAESPKTRLGIQIALSGNTYDGDSWKRLIEVLAGPGGRAGTRPGGLHYTDRSMRGVLWKLELVAREAARSGALASCGQICYEVENWPHIGANKNPHAMMAECSLALAAGCDSVALYWGADQNTQSDAAYDYWFETLARWKPFLLATRDAFRGTSLCGIAAYQGSEFFATRGWLNRVNDDAVRLWENGLPVTVAEAAPEVWYLDPRGVESLGEADLRKLFSGTVLANPEAFAALERKFPELKFTKKVRLEKPQDERAAATVARVAGYEVFPDGLKAEGVRWFIYPEAKDVRSFSKMTADPKAAGTVLVPTEFGGVVVLTQYTTFGFPHEFWPDGRRRAVLDALDAALPGGMTVRLDTDGYSVAVFCRRRPDGTPAGVMLFNLGAGETPPMELAIRRGKGEWRFRRPFAADAEPLETIAGKNGETVVRIPPIPALSPMLIFR